MKCFWFDTIAGIVILDETGALHEWEPFPEFEETFVDVVRKLESNQLPEPYRRVVTRLEKRDAGDGVTVSCEDEDLAHLLQGMGTVPVVVEQPSPLRPAFLQQFEAILAEVSDGVLSLEAFSGKNYSLCQAVTRDRIQANARQEDQVIIQAVEALGDINKSLNVFYERLREWFGLHFPELTDSLISNNSLFTRLVHGLRTRARFTADNLSTDFQLRDRLLDSIEDRAEKSMGAELNEMDAQVIHVFAGQIVALEDLKDQIEKYLEKTVQAIAPNMTTLVGPLVTARLLALGGGLKKLAMMPASRLQLLGAERALFRSLKTDATSPKHGVIFQWPQIRGAKPWHRGKISRVLSGKLAIAARVDYFKGDFVGWDLKREVNTRIEEIKRKYPKPPKKKPRKSGSRKSWSRRGGGGRRGQGGRQGSRQSRRRPPRQKKFRRS